MPSKLRRLHHRANTAYAVALSTCCFVLAVTVHAAYVCGGLYNTLRGSLQAWTVERLVRQMTKRLL
jgi:hypothetical protein